MNAATVGTSTEPMRTMSGCVAATFWASAASAAGVVFWYSAWALL
jgi:hypothetical protein